MFSDLKCKYRVAKGVELAASETIGYTLDL